MAKKIPAGKKQEFLNFYASLRREAAIKECTLSTVSNDQCEGKIVKAHSIQRGKILQSISENGEVFELAFEIHDKVEPTIQFKKVGIKKFSTFSGFCQKHDKNIFQPIEDKEFVNSPEQQMLYAYRAIARELHTKKESKLLNSNFIKDHLQNMQLSKDINDLKELSNYVYSKLTEKDFDGLVHHSYILEGFYPIVCNSIFIPYFDINGESVFSKEDYHKIQKSSLPIEENPFIILNVFPEGEKTYVLISHVIPRSNDFNFLKLLFNSPVNKFTKSISQIMLTHCENLGFSPKYINTKFNAQEKLEIQKFFKTTMLDRTKFYPSNINLFKDW